MRHFGRRRSERQHHWCRQRGEMQCAFLTVSGIRQAIYLLLSSPPSPPPSSSSLQMLTIHATSCGTQGIKDVILEGRASRVGFLYGMRVHQNSQKLGVGGRLLEEAERRSISKGCCRMLLTINGDNKKARSFFDKQGFCMASGRKLEFHPLNNVVKENPPALAHLVKFHPGNDPAALATLARFHVGRELSPVRMDSIATRKPFLGSITATSEDGKSHAGGMMWNASHLATFTFHGHIPDLVRSKTYFFLTRGVAGIAFAAWTASVIRLCVEERYVRASLSTLVVGALVYGFSRVYGVMSFVASRNLKKLRFFGHYASGDQGEQLLRAVFWKARQLACCEFQGGFMILNNDVVEPKAAAFEAPRDRGLAGWLRSLLGRRNGSSESQCEPDSVDSANKLKKARTFFLHKTLKEGGPGPGGGKGQPALGLLSPDMFFDPRDI